MFKLSALVLATAAIIIVNSAPKAHANEVDVVKTIPLSCAVTTVAYEHDYNGRSSSSSMDSIRSRKERAHERRQKAINEALAEDRKERAEKLERERQEKFEMLKDLEKTMEDSGKDWVENED